MKDQVAESLEEIVTDMRKRQVELEVVSYNLVA